MAAIDEDLLIANGVAPSQGNNELHCLICPTESDSDNWKAHIDDPSHVSALRQFNSVFVANGDKIRCKACNMIINWEALRNHAAWHRIIPWYVNEDRDKIFFENRTLRWECRYYCFLCDAIFADWTSAFVHIGEEKHQNLISLQLPVNDSFEPIGASYESLISEGFEPWGKTSIKCRICNCPNVILRNIAQHIEACEHVDAKLILTKKLETRGSTDAPRIGENSNYGKTPGNKNQCAELQENENSKTRSNSQQSPRSIFPVIDNESSKKPINPENSDQMKLQSQISRSPLLTRSSELLSSSDFHETKSEPVTNNTTDLSSDGNPRFRSASNCEIRRKSVVPEANAKNHCAELHKNKNSKTRHNSEKSPRYRQDSQKLNAKKFEDLKILNVKNVKIPSNRDSSNFPVELRDKGRYCIICDIYVSETIDEHVASEKHLSLFYSFGHEYISPLDDVKFHCNACSCVVPNIESVYIHIKGAKHKRIIAKKRKISAPEPKENNVTSEKPKVSQNATKRKTTSFEMNFPQSSRPVTNSAQAKTLLPDHFVKYNSHDFFCRLCNEVVYDGSVDYHLTSDTGHETGSYMFIVDFIVENDNVFRCQPCKLVIVGRDSLYHHVHSPAHRMAHIDGCRLSLRANKLPWRDNEPFDQYSKSTDRSNNWIVNLNRTDYACKICHLLLSDHSTITEHLNSLRHINWLKFYTNEEPSKDEKFDCESCGCKLKNFANVLKHTMSTRHGRSMCLPIKNYSSLELTYRDRVTWKHTFIATLGNDAYICRICNVYLEDCRSVVEHIRDDLHMKTFSKYGCVKVNLVPVNKTYYCLWCHCEIQSLNHVYMHVVGPLHLENVTAQRNQFLSDRKKQ